MYTGIIYKYTSPSGKIYIGQTTREKARRREFLDINRLYAGKAINNARLKYGTKAFTYEVLLTLRASSKEELSKLLNYNEKYFINLFHSNINGYNITDGGTSGIIGYTHTEETKIKIAKSIRGRKHSEETKRKIKEANIGKHSGRRPNKRYKNRKTTDPSKWRNIKIYVYDINMTLVKTFISIKATAEFFNCGETTIRRYLKSGKLYKGFLLKK